tara:strand:+ start:671 stop:1390 length:720 start_codon:yes stop_codon:yes gene_type:complete
MNAIILAAGRGSRLKNLTDEIPKCLIEINKKSLLDRQLEVLNSCNINNISIVKGYKAEKISDKRITNYFYNYSWSETNMVYSLICANKLLKNNYNIITYSDIFYEKNIISKLIDSKDDIVISYDANYKDLWMRRSKNPLSDLETFVVDNNNYLVEIGKKTTSYERINGQYMGLIKISPKGWLLIEDILNNLDYRNLDMTSLLNILIEHNIKIKTVENSDKWGEVDTPSDVFLYENEFEI